MHTCSCSGRAHAKPRNPYTRVPRSTVLTPALLQLFVFLPCSHPHPSITLHTDSYSLLTLLAHTNTFSQTHTLPTHHTLSHINTYTHHHHQPATTTTTHTRTHRYPPTHSHPNKTWRGTTNPPPRYPTRPTRLPPPRSRHTAPRTHASRHGPKPSPSRTPEAERLSAHTRHSGVTARHPTLLARAHRATHDTHTRSLLPAPVCVPLLHSSRSTVDHHAAHPLRRFSPRARRTTTLQTMSFRVPTTWSTPSMEVRLVGPVQCAPAARRTLPLRLTFPST